MKLGAHISISKGLPGLIEKANSIGANCVQLFVTPPRNWNPTKFTEQDLENFGSELKKANIGPNFLHGIYLVNLHTDNPETRSKGIQSVLDYLQAAKRMQAEGVIIHSHRPDNIFISAIQEILDKAPDGPLFIIEHSAITTIEQTLSLFKGLNKDKLGLCLDMCHLFAAGYDIREKKIVDELLAKIDKSIGLDKLKLIHTNDCKSQFNSKRDNHENVGEGTIGKEAFKFWLNHPKLKGVPFILETPGFDQKGPDKQNIDILKSLLIN